MNLSNEKYRFYHERKYNIFFYILTPNIIISSDQILTRRNLLLIPFPEIKSKASSITNYNRRHNQHGFFFRKKKSFSPPPLTFTRKNIFVIIVGRAPY